MAKLPVDLSNPADFARLTRDRWSAAEPFYGYWANRWRRVIDYLRGEHWNVLRLLGTDNDRMKQLPKWKRFPIVGLTLGIYNDQLAQWLQSRVRFTALPASPDPVDIARADMGDQLMRYAWDLMEMDERKIDLGAWLIATGCGSLSAYWNTNTGNLVPLAIPELDEQGRPTGNIIPVNPDTLKPDSSMREPVMVDAGELAVDALSPQYTRYSQRERDGVMVGSLMTYDQVHDEMGDKIAESLSYGDKGAALDLSWLHHTGQAAKQEDAALVVKHFLPRSYRFPEGLWWTATDDGRLLTQPSPLPGGYVPVVPFRWIPTPGHWAFGTSPLYEVTFSNKQMDEVRARQLEWMEKVVPKIMLKAGGGLAQGDINDEPFQEIPVNPGGEPGILEAKGFPREFQVLGQQALDDAMTAAGYQFRRQSELPPGEATQRVRKAPELVEGNEVRLLLMNAKGAWQRLGRVVLSFIGKFYVDSRAVALAGPDRSYQWLEFKGTDFGNLAASIRVDDTPLYPWARQSMRDSVIALMDTEGGRLFFMNEEGQLDKDKLQKAAEAVGVDSALSTLNIDVVEAQNEISAFRYAKDQNTLPQYADYQNSETHLAEKFKVIKSQGFKGWPQPNQQALLQNIKQHQQALSQQQDSAQQGLVQQEFQLRKVRADLEAQKDVRTELGKVLVQMLLDTMSPQQKSPAKE